MFLNEIPLFLTPQKLTIEIGHFLVKDGIICKLIIKKVRRAVKYFRENLIRQNKIFDLNQQQMKWNKILKY